MTPADTPIRLRLACAPDAPALTAIAKDCFAMAPEWRAPSWLSHRWWRAVIGHADCRVFVAADDSGLAGFSIYVPHEAAWKQLERMGPHARWVKLLVVLTHPRILRSRLAKRKRSRGIPPLATAARAAGENGRGHAGDWRDAVFFLGLIAVSPKKRGAKVGSVLLAETERHAALRGAKLVRMYMDPRNDRAQSFYKAHGYSASGKDGASLVMVKALS